MVSLALDAAALAFLAAISWGTGPVIAKKGMGRGGTSVQAAMTVILTTWVLMVGALLAIEGTAAFRELSYIDASVFLVGGIVGTTLGRLANYAGIDRVGASVSTAVMNTRPLFAVLLAVVFLRETLTLVTGIGVVFIVVGVVLLSLTRGGDIRGWKTIELLFPIAAAVFFGAGNVIRRYGFTETPATVLEAVVLNETAAVFTLGVYLVVFHWDRIREADRAALPYFVGSGVAVATGLFLVFTALSLGPVVVVDPVVGIAPLVSTLLTYLFLKDVEVVTPGVIVGALLIVVGGVLVTV